MSNIVVHKGSGKKSHPIVIGKVYANWCGHCKDLNEKEWPKMLELINKQKGKIDTYPEEIEESEMEKKLENIKDKYKVSIEVTGYPTLFRIQNGKVSYYAGERKAAKLANWYLKGGNPVPQLSSVYGGMRRGVTRRNRHRRYARTRKNYPSKPTKGLLEYFFGK
jgi:thiol-disulfide isomerase/thioredoxin